jgi:ferredoxin
MKRMRVVVDLGRCEVYAQCVFAAPTAFRLRGEDTLEFDPMPDDARHEQLLRAARACPVQAIRLGWADLAEPETGLAP